MRWQNLKHGTQETIQLLHQKKNHSFQDTLQVKKEDNDRITP